MSGTFLWGLQNEDDRILRSIYWGHLYWNYHIEKQRERSWVLASKH